ncbi:ABC transporter permease subunit [Paraburkholderia fungorum]|jgi:sulfonate transport system permease protein|uniref:ABC transporter permease n=1 Tax=Paraburkholderia fungorum TaxID=134537 RepID=UPI0038B6F95A
MNRQLSRGGQLVVSLLVLLAMAGGWQVLSLIYTAEAAPGEPLVPGWQVLFTHTFQLLSDYWPGGLGVPSVADGAPRSYTAAALAVLLHSWDTMLRLYTGFVCGALGGAALGLAVSWSNWSRRLVNLPLQFLRTLPLLAMVPLFELWFGTNFAGKILFVAYGVGVIFFAGVVNAVGNVPQLYIDYARTLGASRLHLYRTVIIPAILPELRSSILLSLGTAWAAVLGAEYLGAQSGIGYVIEYASQFGYVDRMFLIALVIVVYASISYALFNWLASRLLVWTPGAQPRRRAA